MLLVVFSRLPGTFVQRIRSRHCARIEPEIKVGVKMAVEQGWSRSSEAGGVQPESAPEILRIVTYFGAIDRELDRAATEERGEDSLACLELHRRWVEACSRVAALPAPSSEECRAKAQMLLRVLNVVSPNPDEREPHELLAASLARDLLD